MVRNILDRVRRRRGRGSRFHLQAETEEIEAIYPVKFILWTHGNELSITTTDYAEHRFENVVDNVGSEGVHPISHFWIDEKGYHMYIDDSALKKEGKMVEAVGDNGKLVFRVVERR